MTDSSGGSYRSHSIRFDQPPDLSKIEEVTLYSAVMDQTGSQRFRVNEDGTFTPIHSCNGPGDPSESSAPEWTCPECRKVWEIRASFWYAPRED